jgi:hypothetical protein
MIYFPVFIFELFLLAALTSHSSSYFLKFFHAVSGSEKAAIILFSVLFFPGTFVHEMAHWLMAKLLFVYSGKMEFLPQIQGDAIKLGSVSIAKTDPVRRLLIGVAPVILGLIVLLGMLWGIRQYYSYLSVYPWTIWLLLGYVVFVTGSTMFSSRKDLEGSIGVLLMGAVILGLLYLTGFDWLLMYGINYLLVDLNNFFGQLVIFMLIPLGMNLFFLVAGSIVSSQRY